MKEINELDIDIDDEEMTYTELMKFFTKKRKEFKRKNGKKQSNHIKNNTSTNMTSIRTSRDFNSLNSGG